MTVMRYFISTLQKCCDVCRPQRPMLRRRLEYRRFIYQVSHACDCVKCLLLFLFTLLQQQDHLVVQQALDSAFVGSTVYHWAGVGCRADMSLQQMLTKIGRNRETFARWQSCKVLIIDEISMLPGAFFERLELIARRVRRSEKPFGGIQVVVSGDFFQLPPVSANANERGFCFETEAWRKCFRSSVVLKNGYRQSDPVFLGILNQIRHGICTSYAESLLRTKACGSTDIDVGSDGEDGNDIVATKLLSRKQHVHEVNAGHLKRLKGEDRIFVAKDEVSSDNQCRILDGVCPAREQLTLKVGAQVILLRNLDVSEGLCNGSRGIIVRFTKNLRLPEVRFAGGRVRVITPEVWTVKMGDRVVCSRQQIPLELAWAVSVHRSQVQKQPCSVYL